VITGLDVVLAMFVLVLLVVCPFFVLLYYQGRARPGSNFMNPLLPGVVVINCLLLLYVIFYDVPKWVLVTVVSLYLLASALRLVRYMMVNYDK
jgi:hypothetical protein